METMTESEKRQGTATKESTGKWRSKREDDNCRIMKLIGM